MGCFQLLITVNNASWPWVYKYLFQSLLSILLAIRADGVFLDHMAILCLNLWGTTILSSIAAASFYLPAKHEMPISPNPHWHLLFFVFCFLHFSFFFFGKLNTFTFSVLIYWNMLLCDYKNFCLFLYFCFLFLLVCLSQWLTFLINISFPNYFFYFSISLELIFLIVFFFVTTPTILPGVLTQDVTINDIFPLLPITKGL